MLSSVWRVGELPLTIGTITVDVVGAEEGRRTLVAENSLGAVKTITSLPDLLSVLRTSQTKIETLAKNDPVVFAFVICVLSDRPHHVFIRDNMWPELEQHFGLTQTANEPRVDGGKFTFVVYFEYMPVLKVSRMIVDLTTLEVTEEILITAPWPPPS